MIRALFTLQISVNHRSPFHSSNLVSSFFPSHRVSEPLPSAHLHQINGTSAAASAKSSRISGFLKQAEKAFCVFDSGVQNCRLWLLRFISYVD
jgi:hypothetical protein